MSVSELSKYTFVSRYARYLPEKKRRETWNEAIDRVFQMHREKYADALRQNPELNFVFDNTEKMVKDKRLLGSQRGLQFGGKAILKKNARIYNCCASYCDRLKFFQEAFWLLLCGSGVGFSVQKHHVEKLPEFDPDRTTQYPRARYQKTFVIPDSIEGWADAVGVLFSSYFSGDVPFSEFQGCDVRFIYDEIRPEGEFLSSSSGKAPGPEPLRRAIEKVRELLERCIERGQIRLKPIDAYDAVMHLADAVLSGGVRRSATICIFSHYDLEMAQAKTGNWFEENPQRGRSNNSALLLRGTTTREQFSELMKYVKEYGEPGFYWADSLEMLCNPCVEIGFFCYDPITMESCWHFCNLCEINGKYCDTEEKFYEACKYAAYLGTIQAGYTDFDYLGDATENLVKHEALLGVSITGMQDNPEILLNPDIQLKGAEVVKKANAYLAPKLGLNLAARSTCIKPAGTTTCVLECFGSGVHRHHYTRYFRLVQSNSLEAPLQHFKKINPSAVEKSVWSANGSDEVITFCVEVGRGDRIKNKISAVGMLETVRDTFLNWVIPGTRIEKCVKPWLTHNVSNTVNVKPEEWDDVEEYIFDNRNYFSGVSLLPVSGDKDYPQAPFQAVYTPREMVQEYGDGVVLASGIIEGALSAWPNNLWAACSELLEYNYEPLSGKFMDAKDDEFVGHNRLHWLWRATRFANHYFEGDVKKMTYCLKDVHNWKKWCDLRREYKPVDYTEMEEEEDNTTFTQEPTCAGGSCLL